MNGEGFGKVYSYLFSVFLLSEWIHGIILLFSLLFVFLGEFFRSKRRPFSIPVGSKTPLAWNFGRSIECSLSTFQDSGGPLFGSRRQKQFCTPFSFRSFLHFFTFVWTVWVLYSTHVNGLIARLKICSPETHTQFPFIWTGSTKIFESMSKNKQFRAILGRSLDQFSSRPLSFRPAPSHDFPIF